MLLMMVMLVHFLPPMMVINCPALLLVAHDHLDPAHEQRHCSLPW